MDKYLEWQEQERKADEMEQAADAAVLHEVVTRGAARAARLRWVETKVAEADGVCPRPNVEAARQNMSAAAAARVYAETALGMARGAAVQQRHKTAEAERAALST